MTQSTRRNTSQNELVRCSRCNGTGKVGTPSVKVNPFRSIPGGMATCPVCKGAREVPAGTSSIPMPNYLGPIIDSSTARSRGSTDSEDHLRDWAIAAIIIGVAALAWVVLAT